MDKYIMALDLGTTSCRCIIFDKNGRICSAALPVTMTRNM